MIGIFIWVIYGLVVGIISKCLHPGDDPVGFLPTIGIGIAGSYIGGLVNYLLGRGMAFSSSGVFMGIIGGVVFLAIFRWWRLRSKGRSFSGDKL